MSNLIKKQYAVKSSNDRYYESEVEVYETNYKIREIVQTTDDAYEAERFDNLKEAKEVAKKYGFEVVSINTYVEELNWYMDNIFKLDGTKKDNINIKNQIYELNSQLPIIIEIAKMKSAYQRERLTALRREGFTEEQALEIIKAERTPFDQ